MNTVETMRRKQMDPSETNYNAELLARLVIAVGNSSKIKKEIKAILKANRVDDLEENKTRNFLFSMLSIFGNGQRPGTLENMTILEFNQFVLINGIECIKVADHKTAKSDGPASVVFALPKLWAATRNYITLFRYTLLQPCSLSLLYKYILKEHCQGS